MLALQLAWGTAMILWPRTLSITATANRALWLGDCLTSSHYKQGRGSVVVAIVGDSVSLSPFVRTGLMQIPCPY